jgi:hypothetical protein
MQMHENESRRFAEIEALAERYYQAIGRALARVAADAERLMRGPVDPERLVKILGQIAILERLSSGGMVPPDLVETFFGPDRPAPPAADDGPAPEAIREQFKEAVRDILAGLEGRLARWPAAEPAPAA